MEGSRLLPPLGSARAGRQESARRWGKAGGVALFILLALTAVECARLGAAGLFVQFAQSEVDRWTAASRTPRLAEVRLAAKYFMDSFDYVSDNPWALEGMGALDVTRMRASRIPREALAYTRDARVRFRQALLQRPTSPFLWANLALTKLYLDEIDDELLTALRQANALGPWEPTVQQTALFVGLAVWRDLDPDLQQTLVRNVERGAARNAQEMLKIVKSFGRFDLVCAIDQYKAIAGPECRKAAASGESKQ